MSSSSVPAAPPLMTAISTPPGHLQLQPQPPLLNGSQVTTLIDVGAAGINKESDHPPPFGTGSLEQQLAMANVKQFPRQKLRFKEKLGEGAFGMVR